MRQIVSERNFKRVVVWFFDQDTGEPVAPITAEWNHVCKTTGEQVADFAPATVVTVTDNVGQVVQYKSTIIVPASQNAMRNACNRQELREILVVADRGLESEWSQPVQYYVRNRQGRT